MLIEFASIKSPKKDERRLSSVNPKNIARLTGIFILIINFNTKQKKIFIIKFTRFIDRALPKIFSFGLIGKVRVWYKLSPSLEREEFIAKSFADMKNLKANAPMIINKYRCV